MWFCPWYPLDEAGERAPARPGIFQVRVGHGLLDYPRGKSTMIHYGVADDVRDAAVAFADAHPGTGWLCRHLENDVGAERAEALYRDLLERFRARFGAPPGVPE